MKNRLLRITNVLLLPILFLLLMAVSVNGRAQTVILDQADLDYAPGETVGITGGGWLPGETVTLTISNLTNPTVYCGATNPHQSWTVVADENGDFSASWYVNDCELGAKLMLTAESSTGFTFELFFTDGNVIFKSDGLPNSTPVSINVNSTNINGTSPNIGNYAATNGSTVDFSYPITVTVGSVLYILQSTSPSSGFTSSNGATNVTAYYSINKLNQTITFNSIANKTYGDATFNPNATSSSGLTVT